MAEEKLYDIRERNYPDKRGDVFRSLQVSECWVCGAKSNEVVMGGWPGYGIRTICPNASNCWHHELEDNLLLVSYHRKKTFIENQSGKKSCRFKKSYQQAVIEFRKPYISKIINDLVGKVDESLKRGMTNVRGWHIGNRCNHLDSVDRLVCRTGRLPKCGCRVKCDCVIHTPPPPMPRTKEWREYLKEEKTFYNPHPGLAGAIIPIPAKVKEVADLLNGKTLSLKEAVDRIQAVSDGYVRVLKEHKYISLVIIRGGSKHSFGVIHYR